ncbi:MAG: hypothetical protein JW993_00260 [Sedimentisphaerales bacterium]|nr:hypothetical protein [Sedimentisphaerales bacterium]
MVAHQEAKRCSSRRTLFMTFGLVVLVCATAYADDTQREEVFPNFVSGDVVRGATRTWVNYVKWWNETRGMCLDSVTELDPSLWADAIAKLKPAYVYTHGTDIVIVRSCHDGNEEGFFVGQAIASVPGPYQPQFTCILIAHHAGGSVSAFRRRGHLERMQTEPPNQTPAARVLPSAPPLSARRESAADEVGRPHPERDDAAIADAQQNADESMDRFLETVMEEDTREPAEKRITRLLDLLETQRERDRELTQRHDLPEEALAETSTDKLFRHYMDNNYSAMILIYSDPSGMALGVQRLLNASSTMHELYLRPDLAEGILKALREYDLSPQSISDEEMTERLAVVRDQPEWDQFLAPDRIGDMKIVDISMRIEGADTLLLSPQFFPKLKGHEKDFLAVLLERYDSVMELRKKHGEDTYGMALSAAPALCLRLSQGLDRGLYDRLRAARTASPGGYYGRFMEELRRFLNQ